MGVWAWRTPRDSGARAGRHIGVVPGEEKQERRSRRGEPGEEKQERRRGGEEGGEEEEGGADLT